MKKILLALPVAFCLAASQISQTDASPEIPAEVASLLSKYSCSTCHSTERKLVGPMWQDIAAREYSRKRIVGLIYKPEPGNWPGYAPMVAQPTVPRADANKIADWIISLK